MATNTEHYNLVKPDYADAADVAQLNDNMDIIDSILWQLANAGADEELLKKVQEILDKIGETDDTGGSTTLGSVFAKLNNIISGNETIDIKVDTLIKILGSGMQEWKTPGQYEFKVPETVTKIKVTATAGGGSGSYPGDGSEPNTKIAAAGAGGAQTIVDKEYVVTPGEIIKITVGAGAKAPTNLTSANQKNGTNGQATVIGNLVTLAGGKAGTNGTIDSNGYGGTGPAGGAGGGPGGRGLLKADVMQENKKAEDGQNTTSARGGIGGTILKKNQGYRTQKVGGGGGAALGKGGDAGQIIESSNESINDVKQGTDGERGGGGAGGGFMEYIGNIFILKPTSGGNGYVKFVWGY